MQKTETVKPRGDSEKSTPVKNDPQTVLLELLAEENMTGIQRVATIRDKLNHKLKTNGELPENNPLSSKRVIAWLDSLGFQRTDYRAQGYVHYYIPSQKIEELILRTSPNLEPQRNSPNSPTSPKTNIPKIITGHHQAELPNNSNGEKNPKIATTITPDLHQYVKNQSKPHGSVASYLKYLILKERDTTTSKPLTNLPPVPSRKTINLCPTEEYAHLHNQLIAELKQKFREQKEDRKNSGGENKPNQKPTPNNTTPLINNVELKIFYKLFEAQFHRKASFII